MTPPTPLKINLKKDEKLEIQWQDGQVSVYPIAMLRAMCPCALCKNVREGEANKPKQSRSLNILPGNYSKPLAVTGAELVGGYAIRLDWSDEHGSGIYSFQYLRDLAAK